MLAESTEVIRKIRMMTKLHPPAGGGGNSGKLLWMRNAAGYSLSDRLIASVRSAVNAEAIIDTLHENVCGRSPGRTREGAVRYTSIKG